MKDKSAIHILVVDDEEMIRVLNRKILQREGFAVTIASTGADAVALARSGEPIDLAIVDQTMPGIDGLETARQLLGIFAGMKVLLCTGQPLQQEQLPADLRQSTAIITKPYRASQLVSMVTSILAIETP